MANKICKDLKGNKVPAQHVPALNKNHKLAAIKDQAKAERPNCKDEDFSREMEDYNLLLHEKAEAFKKLAEALNNNYHRHLNETSPKDECTTDNQVKSKKSKRNQKSA